MAACVQVPVRKLPEGLAHNVTLFKNTFSLPLCIRVSVCVH